MDKNEGKGRKPFDSSSGRHHVHWHTAVREEYNKSAVKCKPPPGESSRASRASLPAAGAVSRAPHRPVCARDSICSAPVCSGLPRSYANPKQKRTDTCVSDAGFKRAYYRVLYLRLCKLIPYFTHVSLSILNALLYVRFYIDDSHIDMTHRDQTYEYSTAERSISGLYVMCTGPRQLRSAGRLFEFGPSGVPESGGPHLRMASARRRRKGLCDQ